MVTKTYLIVMVIVFCILLQTGCSKKEEYQTGEVTPEKLTKDTTDVLTIKPKAINYDSMLVIVSQLVEAVKDNPTDIDYRRALVSVSYDTTWGTILSAGIGKPSQDEATESIGMKYAERAATADALRWAAYIKEWAIDPTHPDLDSLSVEIQGGKVVAKKILPDQTVSVLVEVRSSTIL